MASHRNCVISRMPSLVTSLFIILATATVLCHTVPTYGESNSTYILQRNMFLEDETSRVVGSQINMTEKEKQVNDLLLTLKEKEFQQGFLETFPPTVNFLAGKPLVEKSPIFDIIKRMPKGGILHIHEISIADPEWVIENVTYLPNLYFCVLDDYYSSLRFKFSSARPTLGAPPRADATCRAGWALVSEARKEVGAKEFDQLLYRNITMVSEHPDEAYPNTTMCWLRFQQALLSLTDLYFNTVTFKPFIKQSLKQLVQDNVQYVEIRTILMPLTDVNGTVYPAEYTVQQYSEAIEEFKSENTKDFSGGKIISTSIRFPVNRTMVFEMVKDAVKFQAKYPEHFAGYDLVAQEDRGGPLIDYLDELLYPSQNGLNLTFFFHAGETNWEGTSVDRNLIDAVLLNTSRIGHGYAVNKHPGVMEKVKSRGIAIELNPISNQVLHLVHDIRDHIGAGLIADDYPVVVSSDDPSVWGALPLSHDYYMAFMGMSGQETGLTLLKQLALNTIKYSAMSAQEKVDANKLWQAKWDNFIDEILANYTEYIFDTGEPLAQTTGTDSMHKEEL